MNCDVVIVTYESATLLPDCIASIPSGHRVIVVDNASTDGSADLAESLGCEVVRNTTNAGFGRAVNRAVREQVKNDRVLLLNPDARLGPTTIDALHAAVSQPGVAVAGPRLVGVDGTPQRPWWSFPSPGQAWLEATGLHRLRPVDFEEPRDVDFVVGACLMARTDAWHEVGGFDERYWLYGEEADLCRRLIDSGWRVRYVPEASAIHVGGASGESIGSTVAEHFQRGSERFVLTHEGVGALISFRLANGVGSLVRLPLLTHGDPRRTTRAAMVRRLGRALVRFPTRVGESSDPPVPTRSIVVCSLEAWDDVWRRNQFLVRELTDTHPSLRVLFIEPPVDPLHELTALRRLPRLRDVGRLRTVPGRPHVIRVQPMKPLPRRFGSLADDSLVRQVKRAAARAELGEPTLWLNALGFSEIISHGSWPVLYDITDDWLLPDMTEAERADLYHREERALLAAGEVVVCSPELATTKSVRRPVRLVPNAVDVEHFRQPQPRPSDLPADPVAVYVGTLHDERIDVDLVIDTARSLPQVSVCMIGPDVLEPESRDRLGREPNVQLLGPKSYERVPGYLQHAAALIVPHRINAFTESLDPIKAYESVASGRPTVSTSVAGFRDLGPPVVIADRARFAECVRSAIDSPPHFDEMPDPPTWRTRAAAFDDALRSAETTPSIHFDPPLRVVYIGHTAALSGGELALLRLLPALVDLGIEPHVILAEDGPLVAEFRERGIPVDIEPLDSSTRSLGRSRVTAGRLPLRASLTTVLYARRLSRRIRNLDPAIVHTNTLKAAVYGGLAARFARVPVVWHIRDRMADDYLPRQAARAIRFLARHVPSAVFANSQATLSTLGRLTGPTSVTPSPVVTDAVVGAPQPGRRPDDRPFTVGILGRLAPWKGQHVFLDAFVRAFPDGEERAMVIGSALFGEDDYAESLHRRAQQLGISDRVDFTGFRRDVFEALSELDLLVHASVIPEPFGQVVVEGMAVGLPVIASAAGGPTEVITDGFDGLLCPPGDSVELAAHMRRLADSPDERARLGAAGRVRADDFSATAIAGAVAATYARVAPAADLS